MIIIINLARLGAGGGGSIAVSQDLQQEQLLELIASPARTVLIFISSMSIAITEAITTIAEAERKFKLSRTEDEAFFWEWQTPLPELSDAERLLLDERRRYLYQRSVGQLLEGTVTLLLASPLLTIAGFYDPHFGCGQKNQCS